MFKKILLEHPEVLNAFVNCNLDIKHVKMIEDMINCSEEDMVRRILYIKLAKYALKWAAANNMISVCCVHSVFQQIGQSDSRKAYLIKN